MFRLFRLSIISRFSVMKQASAKIIQRDPLAAVLLFEKLLELMFHDMLGTEYDASKLAPNDRTSGDSHLFFHLVTQSRE